MWVNVTNKRWEAMLELIVLGEIPGAEYQITFVQVLLAALAFLCASLVAYERKRESFDKLAKKMPKLNLKRLARSTEHTA